MNLLDLLRHSIIIRSDDLFNSIMEEIEIRPNKGNPSYESYSDINTEDLCNLLPLVIDVGKNSYLKRILRLIPDRYPAIMGKILILACFNGSTSLVQTILKKNNIDIHPDIMYNVIRNEDLCTLKLLISDSRIDGSCIKDAIDMKKLSAIKIILQSGKVDFTTLYSEDRDIREIFKLFNIL